MTSEPEGAGQHRKGHGHPSAFVPYGLAVGFVESPTGTSRRKGWFSGRNPVVGRKVTVGFWLREQMPDDGEFGFTIAGLSISGHIIEVLPEGRFRAELKKANGPAPYRGRWVVELRYDPSYSDAWVVDTMVPHQTYRRGGFLWKDALRAMATREQERLRYAQRVQQRRSAPLRRPTASSTATSTATSTAAPGPSLRPRTAAQASATPAAPVPPLTPPVPAASQSPATQAKGVEKPAAPNTVFTIGHSTHSAEAFINLLRAHGVSAVADVRSTPASTRIPQFNQQALHRTLKEAGVNYAFLGKELGGRPDDPSCYVESRVEYAVLAKTAAFQVGLDRVVKGAERHRIALLCAEKDPLTCHRTILVARHLVTRGLAVAHILDDGRLEQHEAALERLLVEVGLNAPDLLLSRDDLVEQAYEMRGAEIAYVEKSGDSAA
jgi:hypothetical protein